MTNTRIPPLDCDFKNQSFAIPGWSILSLQYRHILKITQIVWLYSSENLIYFFCLYTVPIILITLSNFINWFLIGFDFTSFLKNKGISTSVSTLPALFSEQLLETLGVKGFFLSIPCNRSDYSATSSGFEIGMTIGF